MTSPRLTPRLEMVVSLAPDVKTYCDIGTDHGYAAIALAQRGGRVIAMDVNKGPLRSAERNIRIRGLEGQIEIRLSDGFSALKNGEAECAVIAGMGGELMAEIIKKGEKGVKYMVLQPQSMLYELRDFLNKNGFRIEKEELCREDERRFYTAMLVTRGQQRPLTEAEKHIGPWLIKNRHPLLGEYLAFRRRELELALKKMGDAETPKRAEYEGLIELYGKIGMETEKEGFHG
ncbi:MAG: tRNA (adenine(22)-N(1))-methyltransferase [Clostridia bacterium]